MENVCKDCGIFLLAQQDVCPCCGWVKTSGTMEGELSQTSHMTSKMEPLIDSLSDDVVPDHFSEY